MQQVKFFSTINRNIFSVFILLLTSCLMVSCGFHLQGQVLLAPPLHRLYLQTPDPYGQLSRNLQQNLKLSGVTLVPTQAEADTTLTILQDNTSQTLLGVNGTQQTRQFLLSVIVSFQISDAKGLIILPPQILREDRVITVQSNLILGSSNEANLYYSQMRRTLAFAITNRLASREVTKKIIDAFHPLPPNALPSQ